MSSDLSASALLSAIYNAEIRSPDSPNVSQHGKYIESELKALQGEESYTQASAISLHIASTLTWLQGNAGTALEVGKQRLANLGPTPLLLDDQACTRAVDLALRIWLTVNVQTAKPIYGPATAFEGNCAWECKESLLQFLARIFSRSENTNIDGYLQIDSTLTAANLVEDHGLRIIWTDNLCDHLRLSLKGRALMVYKHKICMFNHSAIGELSPFPSGLAAETIDTLNLLFPFGSGKTEKLLAQEKQCFYSLGTCGRAAQRQLGHYKYWGDRLLVLCKLLEAPPKNMRQVLFDRRRLLETITLRLAIIVAVLTIFSIVTGILSTYYSAKQYQLALAQACLADNASTLLPQFCR